MKRIFLLTASAVFLFSSCVSSKKYKAMETKQQDTQDLLNTATIKLNTCLEDKEYRVNSLKDQINLLKNTNSALLNAQGDLSTLSKKGAENLERSL